MRLRAVEPHFAAVADEYRQQLRGKTFWLAVHESARIVLARVAGGEWHALPATPVVGTSASTVVTMLARETVALAESEAPKRIYLHGIAAHESDRLTDAGWDVVCLQRPAAAAETLAA